MRSQGEESGKGEPDYFTQFKDMGIEQVRHFAPQWQGELQRCAYKWLKLQADEERWLGNASRAEQIDLARAGKEVAADAALAARNAKNVAMVATIVAVIAAFISIASIFGVHVH